MKQYSVENKDQIRLYGWISQLVYYVNFYSGLQETPAINMDVIALKGMSGINSSYKKISHDKT